MLRETLTNAARYLVQDIVAGVDRDQQYHNSSEISSACKYLEANLIFFKNPGLEIRLSIPSTGGTRGFGEVDMQHLELEPRHLPG